VIRVGKSVAVMFAKEGADIAIVYLPEEQSDADQVKQLVEWEGRRCLLLPTNLREERNCAWIVKQVGDIYGHIHILVNNASEQHVVEQLEKMSTEQMELTFQSNIFAMINLTKHALPLMLPGSKIINTSSVVAYRGQKALVDYACTKGAIVAFTRSMAAQLAPRHIRVNAVAPGPIWTPLIPASFHGEKCAEWAKENEETALMGRIGQPSDVAGCYVFLASNQAAYITGQVLHPNGGAIINT
jgi:NAD(P)-dependent dehydrogenase (short-subunit alcohol dehydrogenase family)